MSVKDRAAALRRQQAVLWSEVTTMLPDSIAAVVAVMPHGGVDVVRMSRESSLGAADGPSSILAELTWRAIGTGKPVIWMTGQSQHSGDTLWADTFRLMEIGQAIVLPLKSFVLPGYPAAVHIYRRVGQPALGEVDVAQLQSFVDRFNVPADNDAPQVFVLDAELLPVTLSAAWMSLEPQLRRTLIEPAAAFLAKVSERQPMVADRLPRPYATGTVRGVRYAAYFRHPVAGNAKAIIIQLQPTVEGWMCLHSADFLADADFGRFLPSLRYIYDHARQSPPLASIARSVHLSPFHFHRKFAEVFGMTPKHFLLDCQIAEAQALLLQGELELLAVARLCGFAHQSHFTSRFKQATGLTPTRWRKVMQRPN